MNVKKPTAIWTVVDNTYSKELYLLEDELNNYDKGSSSLSSKEYNKMKDAKDRLDTLFT